MTKYQKISLFLLRISVGWLLFYAGIVCGRVPKGRKNPGLLLWLANQTGYLAGYQFPKRVGSDFYRRCPDIGSVCPSKRYFGVTDDASLLLSCSGFPLPQRSL